MWYPYRPPILGNSTNVFEIANKISDKISGSFRKIPVPFFMVLVRSGPSFWNLPGSDPVQSRVSQFSGRGSGRKNLGDNL